MSFPALTQIGMVPKEGGFTLKTSSYPQGDWVVYPVGPGTNNNWRNPVNMQLIHPLPDTETLSNELHRKAHSSIIYRTPVGVRGGRWPYRFEIISGPTGATVGNELVRTTDVDTGKIIHEPGPDYGVVTWDASSHTGSFSFTIRVTDNRGKTLDVSWSGDKDDLAFVFLDSVNGLDTNSGTIGSPLQTFANGLWKNSDADSTYGGKIAVFDGSFDINAGTVPSSPILDTTVKPIAFLGINGATFNTSDGHFRTTATLSGMAIQGISFSGSRTDLSNNRIHNFTNQLNRFLLHECSFDNITRGTASTSSVDNPAILALMGLSGEAYHQNVYIARNIVGDNCEVPLITNFDTENILVEFNDANTQTVEILQFLLIKDDTSYVTVRCNTALVNTPNRVISFFNQNTKGSITNQECCYNRIVNTNALGGGIAWNTQTGATSSDTHDYANSVVVPNNVAYTLSSSSNGVQIEWRGAAYVGTANTGGADILNPNVQELTSSDFDAEGKLTGTARTNNLGVFGAEVVGA